METFDAIWSRRNVRRFADRAIADADLDRILEAGRRAPSASNRQPWDFIVTTDRTHLEQLATVWRAATHVASSAATITLVLREPEDERSRLFDQFDLGQAAMSMELAAADLGIGSGHAAIGDQERAREILAVPEGHYCAYLLALGYPLDRPLRPLSNPDRRPFAEVVHRARF